MHQTTTTTPTDRLQELQRLAILSTLMAFAAISTDLYLPALPTMAAALGADPGALEFTISGYLIGFGLGQLFWGPVGDRFGRRWPVAVGLVIFVIGSAGCALSQDVNQLIASRIVQALGACASVVLSRAMVRDIYGRDRAARVMSTLMTIMGIAPLAGPSVGALVLQYGNWPVIFWVLVAIGLVTLAALFTLPETLAPEQRNREPLTKAFSAYGALLKDRRLLGYGLAVGFFFSGTFAYIAGSSFAFIEFYGFSPQIYALIFAIGIVGIMVSNQVNARLVMRLGSDRLLLIGTAGVAIAGVLFVLVATTGLGGVWGLAITTWLFVGLNGLIVANAVSGALADFPHRAGAVSALMGAFQYGSGVLGSAAVGLFANGTPVPMAFVMAISGLGSCAAAMLVVRQSKAGPVEI